MKNHINQVMTVNNTGSAEGVTKIEGEDPESTLKRRWVVAIVKNNTEKACEEKLVRMGFTTYLPIQTEIRKWSNGRKKSIQRIVLPSILFLYVNERERLDALSCPYIYKFMMNRAGNTNQYNRFPIATIPNQQIEMLRYMLYHAESQVSIESKPFEIGDKVRVIRGNLQGLEGNIQTCRQGDTFIVVNLDILGCARVSINRDDVEKYEGIS